MSTNAVLTQPYLQSIKDVLASEQRRIVLEIFHYEPPITRCDVQYNTLLEERAAVNREMVRLQRMVQAREPSPEDIQALTQYITSVAFLDAETKHRMIDSLAGEGVAALDSR